MKPRKFVTYFVFLYNGFWREIESYVISVAFQLWNSLLIAFLAALPITKYSIGLLRVKAGYWNNKFGLFYWLGAFRVQEKCIKGFGEKDRLCFLVCLWLCSKNQ